MRAHEFTVRQTLRMPFGDFFATAIRGIRVRTGRRREARLDVEKTVRPSVRVDQGHLYTGNVHTRVGGMTERGSQCEGAYHRIKRYAVNADGVER